MNAYVSCIRILIHFNQYLSEQIMLLIHFQTYIYTHSTNPRETEKVKVVLTETVYLFITLHSYWKEKYYIFRT